MTTIDNFLLYEHEKYVTFINMSPKGFGMNGLLKNSTIIKFALQVTAVLILFSAPVLCQTSGTILINEFLVNNYSSVPDPDYNQYSDWIELYNNGNSAVDLSGNYLSDDPLEPMKWMIPAGTLIEADDYLLIWADEMDTEGTGVHTNFKLSSGGESLGLYTAGGVVIDQIEYTKQHPDISFGRIAGTTDEWAFFEQPTPGMPNTSTGFPSNNWAGTVMITPAAGFYANSQIVSINGVSGVTIRYTTDGSVPSRNSQEYTTPITISSTTVIKARAFSPDMLAGPVQTSTFFIGENIHLPVFSLSTNPENLWDNDIGIYVDENIADRKSWERPGTIEFFEADGHPGFIRNADIRLFGRTAIYLPQKSLSFFLSGTLEYPLFSDIAIDEFDSFVLRSSSDDWHLTMFRDAFIQKLIRKNMSVATQSYRPAVLFINGEYWGIHNIREKYNEAYLATHYGADPDNIDLLYIDERNNGSIEVLAGDRVNHDALISFVENNNLALQENYDQVSQMVDIDDLIDYVIAESMMGNVSWAHNIRAWRPRTPNGKWRWLVFDMDRGYRDLSFNSLQEMSDRFPVFKALLDNQNFRDLFLQRFVEYINNAFEPGKAMALLDSLQANIAPEIQNHIDRWHGICGNNVCGISSIGNWQDAVSTMRSIVEERPAVVQQQLRDLFQLNDVVNVHLQVQPPGYGVMTLGEKTTITDTYTGDFFPGNTWTLSANPFNGYRFIEWRETATTTELLIDRGSIWKYYDQGNLPGALWNTLNFNDSSWPDGAAQLGYGDGDETTVVGYGPNASNKYVTTYFRLPFIVADASTVQKLVFSLLRDDGAVVYLNGQEQFRSNMPAGTITYDTYAASTTSDEDTYLEYTVDGDDLISGENILAVEIHQGDNSSSDISFDLELESMGTEGSNGSVISTNPDLNLDFNDNRVLTAVFAVNTDNQLPAEITENTVLTSANAPYIALTDVTVHPNVSLTIEPGVDIQLASGTNLIINGEIHANGSLQLPVVFRGIGDYSWGALCLENATGTSILQHVKISGATTGAQPLHFKAAVSTWNSDVELIGVQMENVQQPFYGNGGIIMLTDCRLDGTGSGDDILNIQYASARIENCYLFGNGELDFDSVNDGIIRNNRIDIISTNSNRDGIDIGSSDNVLIENNRIFNCPDKGISIGEKSLNTKVSKNLIVNTGMGIAVKDDSYAEIDHNTLYNDSVGVSCYEKVAGQGGGSAKVINTIIAGTYTSEFSIDEKSTIEITYTLAEKNLLEGNGNLKGDPKFVAVFDRNFRLQADSPCIDAGDPDSDPDPDSTRTDMGAYYYNSKINGGTGLYINELMADNSTTITDNGGSFSDWIEIYNAGEDAINLGGMYVTDDLSNPALWQIPSDKPDSTTIKPKGFLILWADKAVNEGVRHLDLKLDASGEQLALLKKEGDQFIMIDSVSYGIQKSDVSWGRNYDGAAEWRFFYVPTPGSSNDPLYANDTSALDLIPDRFVLHQNYPNPFNPTTTIFYELPETLKVTVEIFNLLGQRVSKLIQKEQTAGIYKIIWQATNDKGMAVPSGIYFLRVIAGKDIGLRKMILVR